MGKIAIVYWSGTGNTEAMANIVSILLANETPDDAAIAECKVRSSYQRFGCTNMKN